MLAVYYEGKQIAVHRISYIKKDIVVNPIHYQKLTVKQTFDIENTLLIGDTAIDKSVVSHDLTVYEEAVELFAYGDYTETFLGFEEEALV